MLPITDYLFLSFALLLVGAVGVITRRNLIIKLFSVEVILNAATINFMAFSRLFADAAGQAFAMFIVVINAAEILIGLAIIAAVFRRLHNVSPAAAEHPEHDVATH